MSEPTINADAQTDAAGGKKKSKKLFIIVGLVVILLAGSAGGYFFLSKSSAVAAETKTEKEKEKSAAKEADEEDAEDTEDAKRGDAKPNEKAAKNDKKSDAPSTKEMLKVSLPDDSEVKQIVELQPFIINLADTDEARYLRLSVSLGLGEGGAEKAESAVYDAGKKRDAGGFDRQKSDEVLSVEGKTKLRKELLQAAQAASDEPKVEAIYITDFIIQL